MNGALAEGVVPGLLRVIYVGRRSGTLNLVLREERQSLRFRHGHIVNAHTNVAEERLGEMLVRRGTLSEADLARATEVVVRDRRRLGEVLVEMGFIDASGLEDAVALHVHEMLTRVFGWREGTYQFVEDPEEESQSQGELTLKLSVGELILESVQAVRDPDVVRYALGNMDRVLVLSTDPLLRFQKVTLSPADGFVLSRVDGVTSAREIVQMIPLPTEQTHKSLLGLLSTGIVEYANVRRPREPEPSAQPAPEPPPPAPAAPPVARPAAPPASPAAPPSAVAAPELKAPPPPAPPSTPALVPGSTDDEAAERRREIFETWEGLKTRNHFEVLELARSAGEAEVKEAYFRLAKRFHPDVHHGDSLGDLRDELEAVFIKLGEAYDVLRDPEKRRLYEERLGRSRPKPAASAGGSPAAGPSAAGPSASSPRASSPPEPAPAQPSLDPEEQALRAEESIRRAAKLFEQEKYWDAIQLLDEPTLDAAQVKARLRGRLILAQCRAKNPKWAKDAESVLLTATREDPKAVEAWALLAEIYAQKGMRTRAVTMYRKVLELKPDHEDAARYVSANAPAPEPAAEEGTGLLARLFRRT
jgi:tetratricopeptide (TPR) repeat protein